MSAVHPQLLIPTHPSVEASVTHLLTESFPLHLTGHRKIGSEEEYPVVDENGDLGEIAPLIEVLIVLGWKPKYDPITGVLVGAYGTLKGSKEPVEVGTDVGTGTLEVSFPPVHSLFEHLVHRETVFEVVDRILNTHGLIRLKDYAIQPRTLPSADLWVDKGRAAHFKQAFHPSVHMQTLTASSQLHIEVTRAEAIPAFAVMNALAPDFIALNANSPVWGGQRDPKRRLATRQACWQGFTLAHGYWKNVLPSRGSIQEPWTLLWPETFEQLATVIASAPFIVWPHEGRLEIPACSFEDWYLAQGIRLNSDTLRDAYLSHEGTLWWNARLRVPYGTIEIRPCCQNQHSVAQYALELGLIENLEKLTVFAQQFQAEHWFERHRQAIHYGLDAPFASCASVLLRLAEEGLKKRGLQEEELLKPLSRRVKSHRSPAHIKLHKFETHGIEGLIEFLLNP